MNHVYIIAEAGVNHNGSVDLALEMIDVAAACGADAVKFQTFNSRKEISRHAEKAEYQKVTSGRDESLLEMALKLELDEAAHHRLLAYCREKDIKFLSSPFESDSIRFLDELGLDIIKIPSGQVDNLPYLRQVAALGKQVIFSTGMATLEEVTCALGVLMDGGTPRDRITVLHCTTAYPTPFEEVNLRAMLTLRDRFGVRVGYSDHTPGIEISVAAVAMGAEVIEKHFTLDKSFEGPDHQASLDPDELRAMVQAIRNVERALGDGIKRPTPGEIVNTHIARRCIVAARRIRKGETLVAGAITVKSPAHGLSPMRWDEVVGTAAIRDFDEDEPVEL